MEWKEDDECTNKCVLMSTIGTLLNSFLLNILLIAFDIRKQQWLSAILTSTITYSCATFKSILFIYIN
jgi:hypothetical protein